MIARTPIVLQPRFIEDWQQLLATGVSDVEQLLQMLELRPEQLPELRYHSQFPLRVPIGFVKRMRRGDPADPLLRQILPLAMESSQAPDFNLDPVGDLDAVTETGLLQKYHGRALLITTGACAVHCRYCFRRHFPYQKQHARQHNWHDVISHLQSEPNINELILSGGDPLMLTTGHLTELTNQLAGLKHIKRLRIHTRLPIVLPERINTQLLQWLSNLPFNIVIVVHANHPAEIDDKVSASLQALGRLPVTVLNQSVLLRDINDNCEILAQLSERLFAAGTLPYYLHLLDKVQGAAHFDIPATRAKHLHDKLRQRLPGYLLPQLVYEMAGASSKIPVND